jgi:hypothetical protein
MTEQLTHIDMGSIQDFAGLIEEVRAHDTAVMLTRFNEDVAVI